MASRGGTTRPAKGDITPAQFVSCLLPLGIAPEGVDVSSEREKTDGTAAAADNNASADVIGSTSHHLPSAPGTTAAAASASAAAASARNPLKQGLSTNGTSGTIPIVCTDGAMDALRQCHSEFVSLIASELATLLSCNGDDNSKAITSGAAGTRKKVSGKKRSRSDMTLSDQSASLSKIINEDNVMECLERLGMGHIGAAARRNVNIWEAKKRAADNVPIKNEGAGAQGSIAKRGSSRARKKLKKGFQDKDVTAELIAEQERLLAESARAMRERMAKQKESDT